MEIIPLSSYEYARGIKEKTHSNWLKSEVLRSVLDSSGL